MNTNCPSCQRPMDRNRASYHNASGNQRYVYIYECMYDDCGALGMEFTEDELKLAALRAERDRLQQEKDAVIEERNNIEVDRHNMREALKKVTAVHPYSTVDIEYAKKIAREALKEAKKT